MLRTATLLFVTALALGCGRDGSGFPRPDPAPAVKNPEPKPAVAKVEPAFDPNDPARTLDWLTAASAKSKNAPGDHAIAAKNEREAFNGRLDALKGKTVAWRLTVRSVDHGLILFDPVLSGEVSLVIKSPALNPIAPLEHIRVAEELWHAELRAGDPLIVSGTVARVVAVAPDPWGRTGHFKAELEKCSMKRP